MGAALAVLSPRVQPVPQVSRLVGMTRAPAELSGVEVAMYRQTLASMQHVGRLVASIRAAEQSHGRTALTAQCDRMHAALGATVDALYRELNGSPLPMLDNVRADMLGLVAECERALGI